MTLNIMFTGRRLLPVLLLFAQPVLGDVLYDSGSPQRPTGFSNISVNGTAYDVTVTYNNNGASNPLRVGDLPDIDIAAARVALLAELNASGIDSFITLILFQRNSNLPNGVNFQNDGVLSDLSVGSNDWQNVTALSNQLGTAAMRPDTGFAQFSAIPEPRALVILAVGCGGLVLQKWRKTRRRSACKL